ncbi:hypothetical protein ACFLWY_02730 [Chloroflexota bacterium]
MAAIRPTTLAKLPLRIAWLVSMPDQITTMFIIPPFYHCLR